MERNGFRRELFYSRSGAIPPGQVASSPPLRFPEKGWALGNRVDGEETCSTSFCLPSRPPKGKRPGGKPWRNPPAHGCTTFNLEGMRTFASVKGLEEGHPHSLFPQLQWKEWRPASVERVEGGPPHSVPPPFKEKSDILHNYVSFRTLTFQLLPNAFARGIYEAIDGLQQSAMESILGFGNFWKLT